MVSNKYELLNLKKQSCYNFGRIFEKIEYLIILSKGGDLISQFVNQNIKIFRISYPKIPENVEKIILISSVSLIVFPQLQNILFLIV